jgi:hypothetical protein
MSSGTQKTKTQPWWVHILTSVAQICAVWNSIVRTSLMGADLFRASGEGVSFVDAWLSGIIRPETGPRVPARPCSAFVRRASYLSACEKENHDRHDDQRGSATEYYRKGWPMPAP